MLQNMKRNNRDNPGYGKPAGKSGNYKPSSRNVRPDNESRSSSNRFLGDREDKGRAADKPSYRSKSDWSNNPERGKKTYSPKPRHEGGQERPSFKRWDNDKDERRAGFGNKPSYNRHDDERPTRPYGNKPSNRRFTSDKNDRQDSRQKSYENFGKERSKKDYDKKPSFNKPYPRRVEKPVEQKRASYKFGNEWREKPAAKQRDSFSSSREEKTPFEKKSYNRFDSDTSPKAGGELKTVYRGRGRDQKPVYETVRAEDLRERRAPKKFFAKSQNFAKDEAGPKPDYDLKKFEQQFKKNKPDDEIRLNKYIANAGVCSRREADTLIENGLISVNGTVIKELGFKVSRRDKVQYQGKTLNPEKPVYLLLNKPKDFITTTDDPMERKTVMSLVGNACEERIFPVGRLDRNTTGLLLFTNDGELADKLASPANKIKKIYQVTLDKPLTKNDGEAILAGLTLEDGPVEVDDMQVLSVDRKILGLEIHVGRNRIVRRIFAHLGYEVVSLDRVVYAGLTKKDLSRGKYRFLTEKEVINLKFFT